MGISPVPIINKSIGSFVESSNRNSLSISDIVEIESSSDLLADIKHGVFNLVWESETDKSYNERTEFWLAFCWVNSINLLAYLDVGILL